MSKDDRKREPVSNPGSVAANLHEGSRSEYLAQFVFSSFGTAVAVPHQEDSGIDMYCTLLERDGQRAWPRAYYSVQVKSTMAPWVFGSPESIRWIIENPLPIFLCVVQKTEARILVYQTTPRFAAWVLPTRPRRLKLIPGTKMDGRTVGWGTGDTFRLQAPILNFSIRQLLDRGFRRRVADVLKFWIENDVENLARIRCGIPWFRVPVGYKTNTKRNTGWTAQGGHFGAGAVSRAQEMVKELISSLATHFHRQRDMVTATVLAMALRRLSPAGYSWPFDPHDRFLHAELNRIFGMESGVYAYRACESLLDMVKKELAKHGITDAVPPATNNGPRTTDQGQSHAP
jgi:hypothetical protein